jgi:PEP-CTERM/exosortase A-associated glycosyltransferase
MKILHVLNHSLPEIDGYSIRSYNILIHQKKHRLDVLAVTSPKQGRVAESVEEIGGIKFHRTNYEEPNQGVRARPFIKEGLLIFQLYRRVLEIARQEKVDLIHAHSPSLNGLAGYMVARHLRIPVLYEMRSLWEEGPEGQKRTPMEALKYATSRWIETQLLARVNAIGVISQGLKQDLVDRGIDGEKISVFPNGVDPARFTPTRTNERLKQELGLEGRFIVGFVGSFSYWEGLDLLVRAMTEAVSQRPEVHLLFVGGDDKNQLKNLAQSLHMNNFVTFVGKIAPDKILDYYSLIDLFVYPRKKMRLTDLVTPLKPLEAMAMEKLVLASDVGGHRELIGDGTNGFLFQAGDQGDLAKKMVYIATNAEQLDGIRSAARLSVVTQRNWNDIAGHYAAFYSRIRHLQ